MDFFPEVGRGPVESWRTGKHILLFSRCCEWRAGNQPGDTWPGLLCTRAPRLPPLRLHYAACKLLLSPSPRGLLRNHHHHRMPAPHLGTRGRGWSFIVGGASQGHTAVEGHGPGKCNFPPALSSTGRCLLGKGFLFTWKQQVTVAAGQCPGTDTEDDNPEILAVTLCG